MRRSVSGWYLIVEKTVMTQIKDHKKIKPNYGVTRLACYIGYIVQAIVNNFVPLLFVELSESYSIPLIKITFLITINFIIQLTIDLLSAFFLDRIGYRASVIGAHGLVAAGFVMLTVLPNVTSDPFWGILISVAVYAVGGGLLEVVISPIIDATPAENSGRSMSFLHSFYCWGHVGVVLLSALFFYVFGIGSWRVAALLWALVPVLNIPLFAVSPLDMVAADEANDCQKDKTSAPPAKPMGIPALLRSGAFWLLVIMMVAAGASEQAVSQWASSFAERGLGVGKAVGDLAGPMAFAFLMGLSRLISGKWADKLDNVRTIKYSSFLCIAAYLTIVITPSPIAGLVGCAICGFSVGVMWPGTYTTASEKLGGGTAMFALLALAGDVGCALGPTVAGVTSGLCGDNLRVGIAAALVFPVLMLMGVLLIGGSKTGNSQKSQ